MKHTGFRHFWHHVKYGVGIVALNQFLGLLDFPIEHWMWEKLPVLRSITEAMGL